MSKEADGPATPGEGDVVEVVIDGVRRALPVAVVREIATLAHLTPVPTAPDAVRGVTQLRGVVLPVIDLGRADRPGREGRPGDALVLVEACGARALLLVDRALAVVPRSDAEPLDVAAALATLLERPG